MKLDGVTAALVERPPDGRRLRAVCAADGQSVRRPRLLQALRADPRPLVALVAPAGYGKTTLLRDWCAVDRRPSAWLELDGRHEDPLVLLREVARAVDRAAAAARDGRVLVVIDDVHVLCTAGARETLAGLCRRPPEGVTIALASRAELPLPVARLRAEGRVTELRADALAMTRAEAAALCRGAGLRLDADGLEAVLRRTEGWPAALALAAQAPNAPAHVDGRDRLIADYLRDEILDRLGEADRAFLRQASVLDALTGELCDAVLGRQGSGAVLARLHAAGVPLVALDSHGERYRPHRLLADLLRAELHRGDPGLEAALHHRACARYAAAADHERAIRHALAARDGDRAGEIVWAGLGGALERGASGMVEHWLSLFGAGQVMAQPRLALTAAGTQLSRGRGDLAAHWLRGASADAGGALALRAALGHAGVAGMRAQAAEASALLAPDCTGQALCRLVEGVGAHLQGEREHARARLEDGARRAAVRAPLIQALCLAQLGLIAHDEHDLDEAEQRISRARAQVARYTLDRCPAGAPVLAVSAFIRAVCGRAEDARRDATQAAALLDRVVDFTPWFTAQVRLVLARTELRLSDFPAARAQLAGARRLVARIDGATALRAWLRAAESDLATYTQRSASLRAALTPAELRVVQYLPTHLSFREIGELTALSANTVKTQANTAYRKLDACSRSDAVSRARELGLLAS